MPADLTTYRKRLLWRASHRGIKEMDLIVGGFAGQHLAGMEGPALAEFERLLDIPDQDLLSWATGQSDIPAALDSALLRQVLAFKPEVWT
jgi:antitoxin CptB